MSPDGKRHQRKAVSPAPLHPHPPPLQPSSRYSNLELLKALQLNFVVIIVSDISGIRSMQHSTDGAMFTCGNVLQGDAAETK